MNTTAARRREARRTQILDAAEAIISTRGYHNTGIADIATELGIGHGTFYRYFTNKADIGRQVLERVITRVADAALGEDPTQANTLEQYREQSYRSVRKMLRLAKQSPQALALLHLQATAIDPTRLSQLLDAYAQYVAALLSNGVQKGFLRQDLDIETTAKLIVAMIFDGTRRLFPEGASQDLGERWLEAGIRMMFDGVAAPGSATQ